MVIWIITSKLFDWKTLSVIVVNKILIGFLKSLFLELLVLLNDFNIIIYIFDNISYLIWQK